MRSSNKHWRIIQQIILQGVEKQKSTVQIP